MRKMLLSVKPSVYEKIHDGIKIFEHRRNFPEEQVMAYLYVSKPVMAVKGIVFLNKRHVISDWKKEFVNDEKAQNRIDEFLKRYRYAMEISEFQETNSISLDELREQFSSFTVPQSYQYLDTRPDLLRFIENGIICTGAKIRHDFSNIAADQVCVM